MLHKGLHHTQRERGREGGSEAGRRTAEGLKETMHRKDQGLSNERLLRLCHVVLTLEG
jgi:hypothetical protein